MRKHMMHAAILFLLLVVTQIMALPNAQAAPGDFLFLFGAQQHLTGALDVTVDGSGNVYVTMPENIQVFNSSGKRIRKWGSYGSGAGQVSNPGGIAVDTTGRVYVADTGNDRIEIFDNNGTYLTSWHDADWVGNRLGSIAIDGLGQVYVSASDKIKVFDTNGNFLREVATTYPGKITTDANNNLYVLFNGRLWATVDVFSSSGSLVKQFVTDFPNGFDIAVAGNGYIYIAGNDSGDDQFIAVYDSNWTFIRHLKYWGPHNYEHYWIPRSIAADAVGNVYSTDYIDDGLIAFDSSGNLLSQWWTYGAGLGQFSVPQGMAFDSSGKFYETDGWDTEVGSYGDRVQVFTADGKPLAKWTGDLCQTSGLAIDGTNNTYVLNNYAPFGCNALFVAQIFDTAGQPTRKIGAPIQDQDFFGSVFDKSGNLLVTDTGSSCIRVFDKDGNILRLVGGAGTADGQFQGPKGIAIDASGNIFVSDSGNNRIQMFNSSYAFLKKWGTAGSGNGYLSSPAGLALDKSGHVFVADSGNNRIQVFDSYGNFLSAWGSAGDDNGLFKKPRGVVVNSTGTRVYVADTGNNRIEVFEGYGATLYSLSGTVRQGSSTGPVLPGATVSIAGKSAVTTSTGYFRITGIPAGTYTLTISRTGYTTKTVTGFAVTSNRSGLTFYLSPAYTVSGTIRQGSSTGPVLPGATVSLAGKTATTSSTGYFSISGIPAGTYTITISKAGYVTKTITGYYINSNRTGLMYYLLPTSYSISGTVRQANGTGAVIAGATVSIAGKTATTSSTGYFRITGIPSGTYTLTISRSGYATKTIPGYAITGNKSGLVFYLTPEYYISGTVRQGSIYGSPLAGATVSIAGKTATTSSTGTFSITKIPAGTYTLTISKTGYHTRTITGYEINSNKSGLVFYLLQ